MEPRPPWRVLESFTTASGFHDFVVGDLCCAAVSNKRVYVKCVMCNGERHGVIERRLDCVSDACKRTGSCSVVWKAQTCAISARSRVLWNPRITHNRGDEQCPPNPRAKFSQEVKDWVARQVENLVTPSRICLDMRKTTDFPAPAQGFPKLPKVHTMVKTARNKHGKRNALEAVRSFVRRHAYDPTKPKTTPFVVGTKLDDDGFPYVGDGDDDDPFYLLITSLPLLTASVEIASSGKSVFHADATFKLSDLGYPVITCGVTDRGRSYQLTAMFIVSRRTAPDYSNCLRCLSRLVQEQCGTRLQTDAVMGDAEDAQRNAFLEIQDFSDKPYLMCFFHVLFNVRRRTRHLHFKLTRIILTSIFDMHYARDMSAFLEVRDRELRKWQGIQELVGFARYFHKQWLSGRYWRWQVFHTPPGFATTNNPCETFNAALKTFLGRKRYHMQELIKQLLDMTESRTPLSPVSAGDPVTPNKSVKDAAKNLIDNGLVVVVATNSSKRVLVKHLDSLAVIQNEEDRTFSDHFADDSDSGSSDINLSVGASIDARHPLPPCYTDWEGEILEDDAKRAGAKLYRKAVDWSMRRALRTGMPANGWEVDLSKPSCPCSYFFKFVICAHVVIARMYTGAGVERMLASKVVRKKKTKTTRPSKRGAETRSNHGTEDLGTPVPSSLNLTSPQSRHAHADDSLWMQNVPVSPPHSLLFSHDGAESSSGVFAPAYLWQDAVLAHSPGYGPPEDLCVQPNSLGSQSMPVVNQASEPPSPWHPFDSNLWLPATTTSRFQNHTPGWQPTAVDYHASTTSTSSDKLPRRLPTDTNPVHGGTFSAFTLPLATAWEARSDYVWPGVENELEHSSTPNSNASELVSPWLALDSDGATQADTRGTHVLERPARNVGGRPPHATRAMDIQFICLPNT